MLFSGLEVIAQNSHSFFFSRCEMVWWHKT